MKQLVISSAARVNLREIWDYVAGDNIVAADALLESFYEKFEILRERPEAGRLRPELKAGLRSFPVGRYLIFYTVNSSDIEIARVIHSARDIEGLLG